VPTPQTSGEPNHPFVAIEKSGCQCDWLADALRQATSPGSDLSSTDTYHAIVAALDRLLQANVAAGTLRPDLDAEDVILALAGLWQLDPASDWRAQSQRIYDIVLTGLRRPA
jgi:transcriptional regulator SbtR-like protein